MYYIAPGKSRLVITGMYNFLFKFLVPSHNDITVQLLRTKDYGNYESYDYIGFVDNKVPSLNRVFLFKYNTTEEEYKEVLNCNYNFSLYGYSSYSKFLIVEVKNKEYLKNITIKMRSL